MKVVSTSENKTQKVVSIYPLENFDIPVSTSSNIVVKVQPNNFLLDNKQVHSNSNSSSSLDLNKSNYSPKNNPNSHVINNEINTFQDVAHLIRVGSGRHHNTTTVIKSDPEKADSETNVDITSTKNIKSEEKIRSSKQIKDSTTPSRESTRNILFDNAQNITPIVLTKITKTKEEIVKQEMTNTESSSENMLR